MSPTESIRTSISEVGQAVRRPEELARRWKERGTNGEVAPPPAVFAVLLFTAVIGTASYGLFMHLHRGLAGMGEGALLFPLAAGMAWVLAFPALYIINTILGSRLDFSTTALAATITVAFGATAMLASIPITWFFTLALPFTAIRWTVNFIVFAGVGICMSDVFLRVMKAVEPTRSQGYAFVWLMLLSAIGVQLFWLLGLFNF